MDKGNCLMPYDTWHNGEVGYLGLRVLKWELWQFIPQQNFVKMCKKIMRLYRLYSEIISNSNSTTNLVEKNTKKSLFLRVGRIRREGRFGGRGGRLSEEHTFDDHHVEEEDGDGDES